MPGTMERSVREILAAVVPLALATAVSPLPLLVLLVLLLTSRAVSNGIAFALGWAVALLMVALGTLAIAGSNALPEGRGALVPTLEAVLGLALLGLATWQWHHHPRSGSEARVPGWLNAADECTPIRAFGLGFILVVLNPKVFALTVGAVTTIAAASSHPAQRGLGLAVYTALGTAAIGIPLGLRAALGIGAIGRLEAWRGWLITHGHVVATALLGAVGLLLLVRGVRAL
jgi:hypothetical protein